MKTIQRIAAMVWLAMLCTTSVLYAQVKVGSSPTTIGTNVNLEVEATNGNKTVIKKDIGDVGIGTAAPTNKLHVISPADPLKLEGVQNGAGTPLIIDANGVVKKQTLPAPTLRASVGLSASYDAALGGTYKPIPFDLVTNNDGNFSTSSHLYTVSNAGTYQISGVFDSDVKTPNGVLGLGYIAKINNDLFQLNSFNYTTAQSNIFLKQRLTGTLTIKLSVGDTIGLGTISCSCLGEYWGAPTFTNMTIVKLD